MFHVELAPLSSDDLTKIANWASKAEAQQLLVAARSKRADHLAKAEEAALSDAIGLIGDKGSLPSTAMDDLAKAARLTVFLDVWEELTRGEPLHTARVTIK